MIYSPISYIEPVFRPPSEAYSFILPVTNGCSWNKCTYCEMYTQAQKKFHARKDDEILTDIQKMAIQAPDTQRVFLADGDAMILPTRRLVQILQWLNEYFPQLERVSSYCLPRNLLKKSVEDLQQLKQLGLDILYVGMESGDDLVLEKVCKGETMQSTIEGLNKIRLSGLRSSVMVLNGLGGRRYSEQHAVNSALVANKTQPDYLSLLVVSFPVGEERFRRSFEDYEPLDQLGLFKEVRLFIENTELQNTVFRSDHASNYLVLKGKLGADRDSMLATLDKAIQRPGSIPLRQEWQRGL